LWANSRGQQRVGSLLGSLQVAPDMVERMDEPTDSIDLAAREAAQRASDERATRLLKRFGIGLAVVLAIWIAIVMVAFVGR